MLGFKNFLSRKEFQGPKFWSEKNGPVKILDTKNFVLKKIWVWEEMGSEKGFESDFFFDTIKHLVRKNFWV